MCRVARRQVSAGAEKGNVTVLRTPKPVFEAALEAAKQLGISEHQLSHITNSNSGEGVLFYGDVTIPFVDRFPRGEIYNQLTTRPEDLKNEAKTE